MLLKFYVPRAVQAPPPPQPHETTTSGDDDDDDDDNGTSTGSSDDGPRRAQQRRRRSRRRHVTTRALHRNPRAPPPPTAPTQQTLSVNVRCAPSLSAACVGKLTWGDVVLVVDAVRPLEYDCDGGGVWYRITEPQEGYCVASLMGRQLFGRIVVDDRLTDAVSMFTPATAETRGVATAAAPAAAAYRTAADRGAVAAVVVASAATASRAGAPTPLSSATLASSGCSPIPEPPCVATRAEAARILARSPVAPEVQCIPPASASASSRRAGTTAQQQQAAASVTTAPTNDDGNPHRHAPSRNTTSNGARHADPRDEQSHSLKSHAASRRGGGDRERAAGGRSTDSPVPTVEVVRRVSSFTAMASRG